METINDRLQWIVNEKFDGNKAAFAKAIGIVPTSISNYLGKHRYLSIAGYAFQWFPNLFIFMHQFVHRYFDK